MAFDGCFHDDDIELTPFPKMTSTLTSDPLTTPTQNQDMRPMEGTRLRRRRSVRQNVNLLVSNSYMIDSYSRLAFPLSYLLFNTIYWSLYSWSSSANLLLTPKHLTDEMLSQTAGCRTPVLHRAPEAIHRITSWPQESVLTHSAPASSVILILKGWGKDTRVPKLGKELSFCTISVELWEHDFYFSYSIFLLFYINIIGQWWSVKLAVLFFQLTLFIFWPQYIFRLKVKRLIWIFKLT